MKRSRVSSIQATVKLKKALFKLKRQYKLKSVEELIWGFINNSLTSLPNGSGKEPCSSNDLRPLLLNRNSKPLPGKNKEEKLEQLRSKG